MDKTFKANKPNSYLQKLLQKQEESQKRKEKIDKFITQFDKYEKGELTTADFKEFLLKDLEVKSNQRVEKILASSSRDGKDFKSILANLKIFEKNETASATLDAKTNSDYQNKYMRYKRNPHQGNNKENDNNRENSLMGFTRQLLKREISGDQYRQILRENEINPNVEGINKIIRQHENGKPTKFDELYYAIHKFQADIDPSRLKFESKHHEFNGVSKEELEKLKKSMVPDNKGNGLMYLALKKPVYSKYNNFNSNKDLFDWESSALNKFKSGELQLKELNEVNPKHKIIHASKIFSSGEPQVESNLHKSRKKSCNLTSNSFLGSGDFLTWRGDVKGTSPWETKEIKRKNPNELRNEVVQEKNSKKLNTMQIPSKENMLITSMAVI